MWYFAAQQIGSFCSCLLYQYNLQALTQLHNLIANGFESSLVANKMFILHNC